MSTESTERRTRLTCDACGLPYYADETESCPYCQTSGETQPQPRGEPEPPEPTPRKPESAASSPTGGTLLDRVRNGVRDVLSR